MLFKKDTVASLFIAAGFLLSSFVPQDAGAAAQMSLNLVWARLADVNGEEGSIESAEFSPDSRFIVTGSKFDNQVIMWRTSDGTEMWRREIPEEIENVIFSPDGKWIASISEDFMLNLFRASDGHLDWSYERTQGIDGIASGRTTAKSSLQVKKVSVNEPTASCACSKCPSGASSKRRIMVGRLIPLILHRTTNSLSRSAVKK